MFVRTEEEIYDTERTHDLEIKGNKAYQTIAYLDPKPILLGTVVKKAETIEELCDGLIVVDTHCPKVENGNLWGINELKELYKIYKVWNEDEQGRYIVYGFIQTDKGLIFVAKMNEKGELELLWTKKLKKQKKV